jgi:glucosamine--fructose-6-phosphate aminotransferase (isomerizing)
MCGIVGVVNGRRSAEHLLAGLKQLEYRGYDSSGIAVLDQERLVSRKAVGKLDQLVDVMKQSPVDGPIGIAHTRWATHGAPNEINAHPHLVDNVAVVHNGIIENFRDLRQELSAEGHVFESETDTEVVPHLIRHYIAQGMSAEAAIKKSIGRLDGAYALGILLQGEQERLFAARRGSPLAVGHGVEAMYIASDGMALAPMTDRVSYLEDGDIAVLNHDGVEIVSESGQSVERTITRTSFSAEDIGKAGYRHYMLKEINEQPTIIRRIMESYLTASGEELSIPDLPFDFADVPRLSIVACGTSSYAGQVARYWFEQVARIPVDVDIASEFRYRNVPLTPGGAALFISQSGETADTLAALKYAKLEGQHIISLVNVPESTMARESDAVLKTYAGPEIGVASTKAFIAQLTTLAILVVSAGLKRGTLNVEGAERLVASLKALPSQIEQILAKTEVIDDIAKQISGASSALFLGRGTSFPIALEGALKLKEISYIHAEGFGAGELKHGPIALVDEETPVVALAPMDSLFEKSSSNLQEVRARGASIFAISEKRGLDELRDDIVAGIEIPDADSFVSPLLQVVVLQLLSYMVAVRKGTDVDQPRNLAKSVTVE